MTGQMLIQKARQNRLAALAHLAALRADNIFSLEDARARRTPVRPAPVFVSARGAAPAEVAPLRLAA